MDPNAELELDYPPFFRRYKSGRIERLRGTDVVPASVDPATGVDSKDVTIDPITGVSARLYLPLLPSPPSKLPVLVYYHGGGFLIESPFSPPYHTYLTSLAAKAGIIVVSVHYRLAPEHPIPAAYDDSWEALKWVVSHSDGGGEAWLAEHGDFARVFLSGDSAGANIAYNVAMRAGAGVKIEGLALVHPYFWGSEPLGTETTDPASREFVERVWRTACPTTEGADDPLINPLAAAAPPLKGLACRRVVVFVAGKDILKERGRAFYEALVGCGWEGEAELVEDEGMDHVFHLFDPASDEAVAKMEKMVAFLKGY